MAVTPVKTPIHSSLHNTRNSSPPIVQMIATPRSPSAKEKTRRIKSLLLKLQCCLLSLFLVLLGSTINVARLSGHIREALDVEVQDSKASVAATLRKFRKQAIQVLEADDDKYVKIKKEDYLQQMKQGKQGETVNLKGSLTVTKQKEEKVVARQMEQAGDEMDHEEVDAAQQMEDAGDKMDRYPAKQQSHQVAIPAIQEKTPINPANIPARPRRHYDNRWEMSDAIPDWMKDYFVYQNETRALLNEHNWKDHKFLVATCFTGQVCGNVAHRLRPIPALLRVAYNTGRLFFLHWGDDHHSLETFLEPPHHGGLDWRLPDYLMDAVSKINQWDNVQAIDKQAQNRDLAIITTMVQDDDFAEPYYNQHLLDKEEPAEAVFGGVFNVMFKPTAMLYERVEETQHTMGLFRGKFASVHIDYEDEPKTADEKEELALKVQNAMNCASNLRPGGPFLIAAQTFAIATEAVKYAKKHNVKVGARQVAHDTATLPHDIWNSFLEIYFMANSKCIAYGKAGYGQLGYILGYDYNCKKSYRERTCQWTSTQEEVDQLTARAAGAALPEEQAQASDDDALHLHRDNVPAADAANQMVKGMPQWLGEWWTNDGNQALHKDDPWMTKTQTTLPEWLKAYFSWHTSQTRLLTADNYKNGKNGRFRYLVLTCYAEQHCGNVPNRLRPLPAHLRVAAETQRILLIHWDKPNLLETFVQPPPGSIQWQVPDFLMWKVRASAQQNNMDVILAQSKQYQERKVVNSMFNADSEGEPFYNHRRGNGELPAERVLRDVFHTLFQPTPALQQRIQEMFGLLRVKPGEYAFAHIDDPRVSQNQAEAKFLYDHVEKAMNCLSQIAPGSPYLAFAETLEGSQMVSMFGRSKGILIPAKPIQHDQHLIPRDVMGSFAELYIASMGKCVAYNNGGFGRMASMLQDDDSCRIRYAGKDAPRKCEWNDGKTSKA